MKLIKTPDTHPIEVKQGRPDSHFVKVPRLFFTCPGILAYERLVLFYIFSFDFCFVGQSQMGKDLGISRATIQRAINGLLAKKIIRKERKSGWSVYYIVNAKKEWVLL